MMSEADEDTVLLVGTVLPSFIIAMKCLSTKVLLLASSLTGGKAFAPIANTRYSTYLNLTPAQKVHILPTEADVTSAVHSIVSNAAKSAIESRGHFTLAIPGGSVLKVLTTLEPEWDVSKTTLAFVNHKCVPIDDVKTAIEAQARTKFLDRWGVDNVVSLGGTSDGEKEASEYEAKLKSLSESILPRDADGFPVFDLALIGVGDDGHIGSLYPNRDEIDVVNGPWVVPAFQKDPPSISLTLPVMQRAKQTVISAAGKSEKYPNGKAAAMRLAVGEENITPKDFPATALRECAVWIFDEPNGSELAIGVSSVEKAVSEF